MISPYWQHLVFASSLLTCMQSEGPKAAINLDKGPLALKFSVVIPVKAHISYQGDMTTISVFLLQMALRDEWSKVMDPVGLISRTSF